MKILSVGNSFSQDAHTYLHDLAERCGYDVFTVNLYIGGCSLEKHWTNFLQNLSEYSYQINGCTGDKTVSLAEALDAEAWDVVTFQQASHFSGCFETYEPYLSNLVSTVRGKLPFAKLYFHQTWAYEIDSEHDGFKNYQNSQIEMFERIIYSSQKASESINLPIIPCGKVIQNLRENLVEFDYKNGGKSLCRDGFHLSLDWGRFAASLTFLTVLVGKEVPVFGFSDFDKELIFKIKKIVNNTVFN